MNRGFVFVVAAGVFFLTGVATADVGGEDTKHLRASRGACCYEDGQCSVLTQQQCETTGGIYQSDGVPCSVEQCPGKGACCFDAESCINSTQTLCGVLGGEWQGEGSRCETAACQGACCLPDEDCSTDFDCDGKVVQMTMIWDGAGPVRIIAYDGNVGAPVLADIDNIQVGDEVTVGPLAGPNDSIWQIFEAGTDNLIGQSKFHRSCSDDEMDGPEDCGNREGNGKGNDNGFINDWILEGLVDEGGNSFDCGQSGGNDTCMTLSPEACMIAGGVFNGRGVSCDDVDCVEPTGACCLSSGGGDWAQLTQFCCESAGGVYMCDGTTCADSPCFECSGKVVLMTMAWDGTEAVRIIAYDGNTDAPVLADIDNIQIGDVVTVGPLAGPNDSIWQIFEAGTDNLIGESKFHRSCSDDEMDGPEDCGNREGNGKDNNDDFINDWILQGLVDENGAVLDCAADCTEPRGACCLISGGGDCTVVPQATCDFVGGFYSGDETNCTDTPCFDCSGKVVEMTMIWDGTGPVRIIAYDGDTDAPILADIDDIQIGDVVTVGPLNGPNDSIWQIFEAGTDNLIGESKFHRSCSDDEMNGAEDCGNREGDGKGNDDGFINDWLLEGLVDENGGVLDCGAAVLTLRSPGADVNGDGRVDSNDVLTLLSNWGACRACPEDINNDGMVDFADMLEVLTNQ